MIVPRTAFTLVLAFSCLAGTTTQAAQQMFEILGFKADPVRVRDAGGKVLKSVPASQLKALHGKTLFLDPETMLLQLPVNKDYVYFATKDVKTDRTDVNRPPGCAEIPAPVAMMGSSAAGDVGCDK